MFPVRFPQSASGTLGRMTRYPWGATTAAMRRIVAGCFRSTPLEPGRRRWPASLSPTGLEQPVAPQSPLAPLPGPPQQRSMTLAAASAGPCAHWPPEPLAGRSAGPSPRRLASVGSPARKSSRAKADGSAGEGRRAALLLPGGQPSLAGPLPREKDASRLLREPVSSAPSAPKLAPGPSPESTTAPTQA
jgi:hypothetical protein